MIVNTINDPIIGYWSDNTDAKKWGSRRLVFIKYFSPVFVVVFVLMWIPWGVSAGHPLNQDPTNQFVLFIYFVITMCMFDTLSNIVVMTWMALLPDMTSDLDERAKINFLGSIIGLFTGMLIIGVPAMAGDNNSFRYFNLFAAIVSIVCYFLVVKFSKESPEHQQDKSPPILTAIKQTLKSKSFLSWVGFNFFKTLISSIQLTYLYILLMLLGSGSALFYFFIAIFIGFGANVLCMKLRPKYGFKKLMITFGAIQCIGGLILLVIISVPELEFVMWPGLIFSTIFGGAGVFGVLMQTLPIDEDEIKYGYRRETMFYGVNALLTRWAESIGPLIAFAVLLATNYVPGPTVTMLDQPPEAVLGIKFFFYGIVNIFVAISLIFVYLFPLEGEKLTELGKQLEELHEKKRADLSSK
jgi:GPH family glycoside/pentoside/hexuronide:cation symporter